MRLTQCMKEQLKKKVIAEKITPRLKALEEKEIALGIAIYVEKIILAPNGNLPTIGELPESWFIQMNRMHVYFNGLSKSIQITYDHYLSIPYRVYNDGLRLSSEDETDKKFCDMFTQLTHEASSIELDKKELLSELDKVLRPINTYKKLIEVWPEASDYLAPLVPPSLPMIINVDKLRSLLR